MTADLRSAILDLLPPPGNPELQKLRRFIAILSWFLVLLFGLALIAAFAHNRRLIRAPRGFSAINSFYTNDPQPDYNLGTAEDDAVCLSHLLFLWILKLFSKGSRGLLRHTDDVFQLPSDIKTGNLENKFRQHLKGNRTVEVDSDVIYKDRPKDLSVSGLFTAFNRAFGCHYYSLGLLKLFADVVTFCGPILLNKLINFMENRDEPTANGYLYASGLTLSALIGAICGSHFDYGINKVGIKIRSCVTSAVYEQLFAVAPSTLGRYNRGEIANFISTDGERLTNFAVSFHSIVSLLFQISVSLYLLHQQVGLSFLCGVAFCLLMIPLNWLITNKIKYYSELMMSKKDNRINILSELLLGVRIVKFYSWERLFDGRIQRERKEELRCLKWRKYLDAFCVYFWVVTPIFMSVFTFITYVMLGNRLTAASVFTTIALFTILKTPMNAFPWVINGIVEAWVSLQRINAFIKLESMDYTHYYDVTRPYCVTETRPVAIEIVNGWFAWKTDNQPTDGLESHEVLFSLKNIRLRVCEGEFIGVVGRVGSGKSSLLSAIRGSMDKVAGSVWVPRLAEGFSFVSQEAWLQRGSVRANILFGSPYEPNFYARVLFACALETDLATLPHGDATEVGESGGRLSGGQRVRVALARAVYQRKPVYLLDDALAAVDAPVARHILRHCVNGLLRFATRVVASNQLEYLDAADVVVVMDTGRISRTSGALPSGDPRESDSPTEFLAPSESPEELELQAVGAVSLHVYRFYWLAIGSVCAAVILLALTAMQTTRNLTDWWLAYWINSANQSTVPNHSFHPHSTFPASHLRSYQSFLLRYSANHRFSPVETPDNSTKLHEDSTTFYLVVYGCLAATNSLFTLVRAFSFAYGGVRAASVVHRQLFARILSGKSEFFDETPVGRIVNRFSSDIYAVDDSLPFILNIFLANVFGIIGTSVIVCVGLPWFLVLVVPIAFIYYRIQKFYRKSSRELKRIYSVSLSPIYAHFSETLSGLETIKSFRETRRFRTEMRGLVESSQRSRFSTDVAGTWLNLALQLLGVLILAGVAFISVVQRQFGAVDAGLVGLAVSYALSVTGLLSGVVHTFTETEKQMVSVERCREYIEGVAPEEEGYPGVSVPAGWPVDGAVAFCDARLVYRPRYDDAFTALDGVCLSVRPGERFALVGRTGSGKSSLFLALFRMYDLHSGSIYLDGIDITQVPLETLRSSITIVTQTPFVFSGSVRENLDPWGLVSQEELQLCVEMCQLSEVVSTLGGLEGRVEEGGKNLSLGQRQLICLTRAVLRPTRLLCLDEATASLDNQSDAIFQHIIRRRLIGRTVITIAHRISTVMDYDRVAVMSGGSIVEIGPPKLLLADTTSRFSQLANSQH